MIHHCRVKTGTANESKRIQSKERFAVYYEFIFHSAPISFEGKDGNTIFIIGAVLETETRFSTDIRKEIL